MSECGCHTQSTEDPQQRRVLWIALALNAAMAVIGGIAGWWADSTGLLADALDMATDASAYAIGLIAVGRALSFKVKAAQWTGGILFALGVGVLFEVVRRALYGSEPLSLIMLAAATLSLVVNVTVLKLLQPFRAGEVHMRASWVCTRADVVANFGVIASAGLVWLTQSRFPDLLVGAAIGVYVIKESIEILRDARAEQVASSAPGCS